MRSFRALTCARAELQGADLGVAQLQGADLRGRHSFRALNLSGAQLQGADLREAQLQGADLSEADLQGADLRDANLDHSVLAKVSIWRARNAACTNARIARPITNVIENRDGEAIPATPDAIAEFIGRSITQIRAVPYAASALRGNTDNKARAADRMRDGLLIDPAKDDTEAIIKVWRNCEKALTSTMPEKKFDEERAAVLRYLVCDEEFPNPKRKAIGEGIIRNWVSRCSFPILVGYATRPRPAWSAW